MHTGTVQGFELSPQQKRLWRLQESGVPALHAQLVLRIEGPLGRLDRDRLRKVVTRVVSRYDILRTGFAALPGMSLPLQVPGEPAVSWGPEEDLTGLSPRQRQVRVESLLEQLRERSLDWERGPLLHAVLLAAGPGLHLLVVDQPALCADSATLDQLAAEIAAAYLGGQEASVGEDPALQYCDLAAWQNELLEDEAAAAGREYWQRQAPWQGAGDAAPFVRPAAPGDGFAPCWLAIDLPPVLQRDILDLAQQGGGSVPGLLLACWQALAWRLTDQEEVLTGVSFDGRRYEETLEAPGPLARYLPVLARPHAAMPLAELRREAEEILAQHSTWQECFVWESAPAAGRLPARVALGFTGEERRPLPSGGGLSFGIESKRICLEAFALHLRCSWAGGELALELTYDALRCDPRGARRLAGALTALLSAATAAPQAAIGALGVLGAMERQQTVIEWNDTWAEREACCLHELFARQAALTPDAVAVVAETGSLTYAELSRQGADLARMLGGAGVGPDVRVGLFVERSPAMVVGMLGIFMAGGAYVPLDPSYPGERTAYVLRHAAPRVLLTQSDLLPQLPATESTVLVLDQLATPEPGTDAEEAPAVSAEPDNLAYVLYTSGSSGRPKGVMVSHRAIFNRLLWQQSAFPLTRDDRVLQKTPFAFDASIWEIWSPLLAGACTVLARPDGHQDAAYIVRTVAEQEISTFQLVPSQLQILLAERDLAGCRGLRRLFCGGEALRGELAELALTRLPVHLQNLYGPTETAIDATSAPCRPGARPSVMPIGRPIENLRVYLLDRCQQPVPSGIPGEIHIGGVGLARGYLDRADLTAERFVPDPFGGMGSRLYRTGDLGCQRPDGIIEFLGRIDRQVKLHGVRIELDEIEAVLAEHAAVREAVVVVRDASSSAQSLVAYVVPEEGTGDRVDLVQELSRHLAETLPRAMVPAAFVVLKSLPRTPNGKLDRLGLPAPESAGQRAVSRAARNLTEEVLAGLWAEILGLPRVGVEESFFELGGHSLSATQMASRVRLVFGVELALRTLFDHPTIAALAERIDSERRSGQGLAAPPLTLIERGRDLPLSFSQQRLWFIQQFEPGNTTYNIACGARLLGPLDRAVLAAALDEVVRRHEALRTSFPEVDGRPVQRITPPAPRGLPFVDLSALGDPGLREREARRLALTQAAVPFDLGRLPLLRATLVRLDPQEHAVLLVMHHIVSDGWSADILLRELSQLYAAFRAGRPSPLPELPVQYADFASWQREWLQGEVLDTQLTYWKAQLQGIRPLELPTDRSRPPIQTFRGALARARIGAATAERLRRLAQREGATLFMAALAGFAALMQRYSGQDDVAVGCPIANRNRAEIEPLIGCFVNIVVVRARIAEDAGLDRLLAQVREVSLACSTYQDLPFEQVVEAVQTARDLSRNALFQVVFMLQSTRPAPPVAADLRVGGIEVNVGTAKFDLTLELADTGAELVGFLDFNQDLFDASTADRLTAHLDRLLASASLHPERPLSELDLLAEEERHQLLAEWNDTAAPAPHGLRMHELFARRAALTPEAVAVITGGALLTYGELDRRANRLAHHLLALGARPGDLIGLYFSRRPEMIIAPLAVLKMGGTYVPFDSYFPAARIRWILERFSVPFLLTESLYLEGIASELADLPALRSLCLDQLVVEGAETAPPPAGEESDVAYVIFTSGSTGAPKGVVVRHAPAVNLIEWVNDSFAIGPRDRVLFVTSLCFDLSVYDVFGLLAAGGSIRIASLPELGEPRRLVEILETEPITFWDSAPAMLQQLAPYFMPPPAGSPGALRLVFLSGDWIPVTLPDAVRRSFTAARVIGLGGATEATVWSNSFPIGEVPPDWRSIPYGRPITDARYHVLDDRLSPAPIGVPGDLFIAGPCLASGYAGEPILTASQFMPDPFGPLPGARMYRTGDRARYFADGNLEFLGRRDHQIKIRGFRIELGEVEARLREHPAVREAVALAREDTPGDKRLVAYLIPQGDAAPDPVDLRRVLRQRLPEYMIPSAFVALPELPVTANGKLDRQALPAPERERPAGEEGFLPLRTPTEEALAEIWRDVLAVERVGAGDNFFALGGHSLSATQVISRIRTLSGVELPLRDLFQAETLASLAERVDAAVLAAAAPRDLADLMSRLAGLSDEEAERLLAAGGTLIDESSFEAAGDLSSLLGGGR
jgi:amino acid adenylation domain-containing protein